MEGNRYPTPLIIDVTQPSIAPEPPPESKLAKLWKLVLKYLIAPLPVLLLVIGAVLLVAFGVKNVQVGGLIGKLLGKKVEQKTIDVANSVPADRVHEDGSLIQVGEPDSKGITQAQVVAIQKPGLFSDPKTIKLTPPGADKPIEIAVPDGVKARDVEHVIVVKQEIKAVTVKSTSPIKAADVDDLLARYRK